MSKASASVAVLAGAVNSVTPIQIPVVIMIGSVAVAAAAALSEDIWDGFRGRKRKPRSGIERGVKEQECNAGD